MGRDRGRRSRPDKRLLVALNEHKAAKSKQIQPGCQQYDDGCESDQQTLRLVEQEGLEAVLARHARLGAYVRERLKAMGLKLLVKDERRASDTVTAFWLPEGVEAGALQRRLLDEYGVNLAGGQGNLTGRVLRIGHLGYVHEPELAEALDALSEVLALPRLVA